MFVFKSSYSKPVLKTACFVVALFYLGLALFGTRFDDDIFKGKHHSEEINQLYADVDIVDKHTINHGSFLIKAPFSAAHILHSRFVAALDLVKISILGISHTKFYQPNTVSHSRYITFCTWRI